MLRTGSLRPLVVAVGLLVSLFGLGVGSAFATHYRYGHMTWERDFSYFNPAAPTEIKIRVTLDSGARWSFPWGALISGSAACPGAPFVASGGTGFGSCPALNSIVTHGTITFNKPVKVNGGAGAVTSMTYQPTVTTVVQATDTLYGSQTFEIVFPSTSNPVTVTWNGNARLSTLRDNNNDLNWNVATVINAEPGVSKSPRSTSLPLLTVISGVSNTLFIPTVAFDNMHNKFRVATSLESGLNTPQPANFSLDPINQGVIYFTPSPDATHPTGDGLYAVQLIVTSYDSNEVAHASVPLDFIFSSGPASTSTATLTTASTTVTAPVTAPPGTLTQTIVHATLSPADATYAAFIEHTPLPPNMTFSMGAFNGAQTAVATLNYIPTVQNLASVVCFQVSYTKAGFPTIVSPGQLCINFNLGALQTTMTAAFVGTVGGLPSAVGNPMTATATLTRTADSAPLGGRQISFAYDDSPGVIIGTATTNSAGTATLTFTPTTIAPARIMRATFFAVAGEFLQSSSAFGVPSVIGFQPTLDLQTPPPSALVGAGLPVAAQLIRLVQPVGGVPGQTINFTLTPPVGAPATASANTGATGVANTSIVPTAQGVNTLSAQYSGGGGNATAANKTVTVYQRTSLAMLPVSGTAGSQISVSATLTTTPAPLSAVAGQLVTFTFTGGPASQTATTDSNGVASVTVQYPSGGGFTANAFFLNAAGFFANHLGSVPPVLETASAAVTVTSASTALSNLMVPTTAFVADDLTVSTVLTRTSSPSGPIVGQSVQFTLSGPSGATLVGTTDATGTATVTFSALSARGAHTVQATYLGGVGLDAATSNTASVSVYQRTSLFVNQSNGTAGSLIGVTANLFTVPGNLAIAGETVTFSFTGNPIPATPSAVTDGNGGAKVFESFPAAGNFTTTASFSNLAGFYVDENGNLIATTSAANVNVTAATTSLEALTIATSQFVGDTLPVTTVLTRVSAPSGLVAGAEVVFTLSGASSATQNATTDANGHANVTFALTTKGAHTVTATYAGSGGLAPTSTNASFTAYQRTSLSMPPTINGTAGSAFQVSATLMTTPGIGSVAGQTVTFDFGGAQPSQSGTTDVNGVATVLVQFANAGSFPATASFQNVPAFYANHLGTLTEETTTTSLSVIGAATSLSNLTVPANGLVGAQLPVSVRLNRLVAPAGPIDHAQVRFTLTGPLPSTATTQVFDDTDDNGDAIASFALVERGVYSVAAEYAGSAGLLSSGAGPTSVPVYQRTQLFINVSNGSTGQDLVESAYLVLIPQGNSPIGETVNFSFTGDATPATGSALTDAAGKVTTSTTFPNAGTFSITTTFSNSDFYTDAAGSVPPVPTTASAEVTVNAGQTTLTLEAPQQDQYVVGGSVAVNAVLFRQSDPSGSVTNHPVVFTLTGPSGSTMLTAITNASGYATVSFPVTERGELTLSASFAGDGALSPSTSGATSVRAYQRTSLDVQGPGNSMVWQGIPTEFHATLLTAPGGSPVSGQVVTFNFGGIGPQPASVFATTGADGVATVSVVFDGAQSSVVTATFLNAADFFTDSAGSIPPVLTSAIFGPVSPARLETALTHTSPSIAFVGDSVVVSTVLTRTHPNCCVPLAGQFVVITVEKQGAGTTAQMVAATDANGAATAVFTNLVRGGYLIHAQFDQTSVLSAAATAPTVLSNFQRAILVVDPASGIAGQPITLHATVTAVPQGTPLPNEEVEFATGASPIVAHTNANGEVSIARTFPVAGTFIQTAVVQTTGTVDASSTAASGPIAATGAATVVVAVPDSTPPVITPTIVGTLGSNSWYTSNVVVSWNVADPESGIGSSSGCTTTTTSTDGASFSVTCTASSVGGSATNTVTFNRDASAPTITVSPNKTDDADSWDGADVTYAAATASDPTSGIASVVCAPPSGSTFPIGVTTVSCVATNNAGLTKTGTFTVTIVDRGEPGRMRGEGETPGPNNHKIEFDFSVFENRRGNEWGDVRIKVRDTRRRRGDDERFDARTVDDVFFSNAPDYGPGHNSRTGIDTVIFRGTGRWDGHSGYTYVVTASDRGEPGRGRDTFTIVVKNPNGAVVFSGGGTLSDGNVQSSRLNRSWNWWNGHHNNPWRRDR